MNSSILEKRLIDLVACVVETTTQFNKNKSISHLNNQACRSISSSALNYGEALSASSKKDFIHKLSIVMKKLRETKMNLKIMLQLNPGVEAERFESPLRECDELLAVFYTSMRTARKNS